MGKKVYFAGSIRGGRADAALYRRMIEHINEENRVLTEHIADPSLSVFEGEDGRDAAIYKQDTGWIRECDVLIAECTTPSLGVGYELAFAESIGKNCFVLYNKNKGNLSAMINGNGYFTVFPYETEDEAISIIDNILGDKIIR